ncbi:DUF1330 domain-containing protein [Virgisporangium ochraceum]|uniref:DUF1330 domain-containing protein n=1 Tax=Virgisporangium ochraceum TaxID=65505 RepID=A0A8J3ZZ91_9ACTN|nr:DUF1330 domain-containing protein [Virgisporangium ochraceum]GIJ72914.1 hypothetical protein Voc01_078310 [Virgisporangium ochraceum]
MAVDPTGEDLAAFLAGDPDSPVVMLNLLRFAEGGREPYREYSEAFQRTFAPRYGVEVIYAGNGETALVAEDGQQWDAVLLVRYPTRRAFSQMVADPEYRQITHLRRRALSEAVLQPTQPWGRRPDSGTTSG